MEAIILSSMLRSRFFYAFSLFYRRAFVFTLVAFLVVRDAPVPNDIPTQVAIRVGSLQFDFVTWTLEALGLKMSQSLTAEQSYLATHERKQLVLEYFDLLEQSAKLEGQIDSLFADPAQTNPVTASAGLKAQVSTLRARMKAIQPMVEAILQEQISAVYAAQGFTVGGELLPPIAFHVSALPGFLVVSPRNKIELQTYANIQPGLTADDEAALEAKVEKDLNVAALVAPVGGLGTYPAMVYETTNLNYTLEVSAHEWAHNYLTLRPLGLNYDTSSELRTMNETAATLVGQEIGRLVIARYYPERLPPPRLPTPTLDPDATPAPAPTPDPNAFDFNAEMHETRVKVDELLVAGKIEAAEQYMDVRRQFFRDHGYHIRKLNQAYFAFYGAYNTGPGAAGQDPVGPAVLKLRGHSSSLKGFLDTISWMTSFAELKAAVK